MKKTLLISFLLIFRFISPAFAEPQTTALLQVQTYEELVSAIRETRAASQKRVEQAVDQEKIREAWETGKLINDHILQHKERADYGESILLKLAADLETSHTELKYMLQFARAYPIGRPADQLTWSHYESLLSLNDTKEREEITKRAVKEGWTRDRTREEVKKRLSKSKIPTEKLTAIPGIPSVYRLVTAPEGPYKGQLVMDLGFSNYFKFGNMDEFKAGELVSAAPVKQSKKGLATRFHFKRVLSKDYLEKVHLVVDNQYVVADESSLYTYQAYVTDVIDGDTFKAMIDLGFGFVTEQKLRLRALDAPEIESSEGREAKTFLEKKLLGRESSAVSHENNTQDSSLKTQARPVVLIKTVKSDKYDRYLVDVWADGKYLNQALLDEGLAVKVEG